MNGEQKMMQFFNILCLIMIVIFPSLPSELIEVPRNIVVLEGKPPDAIDMTCKSDYQSRLKWDVRKNNDSRNDVLFNGFYLRPDAKIYCTVLIDESGKCNLRLRNTAEVAQTYICVEPGSLREASADLIWITESDPACNDSSTEDLVNLTCSIEFRGNWAPTMEWKEQSSHGEKVFFDEVNTVTVPNQHVTSTLVMKVQEGSRNYTCTTKFDISRKPPYTTATNIPDYNRVWTASVLPKTQEETVEGSPPNEMEGPGLIVPLIAGIVTLFMIALLSLTLVTIRFNKRRKEPKEMLEVIKAKSVLLPDPDAYEANLNTVEFYRHMEAQGHLDTDRHYYKTQADKINGH